MTHPQPQLDEYRRPSQPSDEPRVMVRLRDIQKRYPGQANLAVDNLSLDIHEGEIFSLLGPSGCGKTTTLRMVAGLEMPDHGSIHFKDRPIVVSSHNIYVPPEKRNIGMVFQSYAIWPHMTVAQNIAYPLKARKFDSKDIEKRVRSVLDLVGMGHLADRSAMMLSGGQQQRVALARALVYEPSLLLLDEPFSNLDTKLREQMRVEIKMLQIKLGITVLFVTHDQVEALSLSTRLAVMHQGVVQQVGTPRALYEQPANAIVRDFIGRSVLLKARVIEANTQLNVFVDDGDGGAKFTLNRSSGLSQPGQGQDIHLSLRPEDIKIVRVNEAKNKLSGLSGIVEAALFEGERTEYRVRIQSQHPINVYGSRRDSFVEGEKVWLDIPTHALTAWIH
jgi:ABC-type branched-subunit amino acid transport system ATPase component